MTITTPHQKMAHETNIPSETFPQKLMRAILKYLKPTQNRAQWCYEYTNYASNLHATPFCKNES